MNESFVNPHLKSQIIQKVQTALNRVHSDSEKRFIRESLQRLNFACPYCGDSSSSLRKKRGNLYWSGLNFHCYNCSTHKDLDSFLSDFSVNFEGDQRFQIIDYIKENKKNHATADNLEFELFRTLNSLAVTKEELFAKLNIYAINEHTHRAYPYLRSRLQIKNLDKFAYDPRKKMLYIFNLTAEDKIIGFQTRDLTNTRSAKYLSYNLQKMYDMMGKELEIESEEELDRLNKVSMLFGILHVNLSSDFTVFEGPLDSFFMHNSIALTGVAKNVLNFDELPTVRYFFDNDIKGKQKMIEKLKLRKNVFMWSKFLGDFKLKSQKIKDMNDLISVCYNLKNPALRHINDYFTNDPRDIIYV